MVAAGVTARLLFVDATKVRAYKKGFYHMMMWSDSKVTAAFLA
jgi:hypothetical protein